MLKELKVRNFAIVEDGRLEFDLGLTAFTGETGAGKSLLFDAVTLLLGGKARSQMVRTGANSAEVEGVFDLSQDDAKRALAAELGFEVDGDEGHLLFIRREISALDTAKNRVWIQGKSATRSQLQSLLGDWVEVSGQHEFLRLGREDYILHVVDQFGQLSGEADQFAKAFALHSELVTEFQTARTDHTQRATRIDFLRFQAEELERAGVGPDAALEEERLLSLRARLGNIDRIGRALESARRRLEGSDADGDAPGALTQLQSALRELGTLQELGEEFRELVVGLEQVESQLGEWASRVNRMAAQLEADPESLEQAESKLSLMMRVKRKYGREMAELGDMLAESRAELLRLENSDERLAELEARCESSKQALTKLADKLHARRVEAAAVLAKAWEKDLRALGMKQARLKLEVSRLADFRESGVTRVEALFSANAGESERSLGKVASGGELSRILLALKHIVAGRSEIGIYLFDEVDSGIGGETAHAVAARLRGIAEENQVIVVTHLAQIAAASHAQFRIRKVTEKGKTRTLISPIEDKERSEEIARMLGDTGSKAAQKLAKELLRRGGGESRA
ncbi:MAG: DNA repair protein RecN [Bdellovibrionales bacterium]|nr:DNA repair protein RecN [Bdellovibrionales bacterium]